MSAQKILTLDELEGAVAEARRAGKRVVMCHGVFDLVHPGHILHFQAARKAGDLLVVTVTPDHFVNKGPGRPVFGQRLRLESLAALECVDYVALNEWPTAIDTIHKIKPSIYVKGSEYADATRDITGKISEEEAAVKAAGGEIKFTYEQTFSSSSLLNEFFRKLPPRAETFLKQFRARFTANDVIEALRGLKTVRVLVIGEAIVDQYCYCAPLGKSPKETIIATKYASEENFAGGSLAVANHVAGFCEQVSLVTYLGHNSPFEDFIRSKLRPNVKLHPVYADDRPTIVKRRYVDPAFLTKMFEVQRLEDTPLPAYLEDEMRAVVSRELQQHDMVIAADFGHGLFTDAVRQVLYDSGKFLAVNTQTNSANLGFNPATKYQKADYVCVHEGELKLALRVQYGDVQTLTGNLRAAVHTPTIVVTRGPNGSLMITHDGGVHEAAALSGNVVDRVGAGDTFFALTAPCVYKRVDPEIVGFVGNCAGAMAVGTVCNREPVDPIAFQKFISHLLA